MAWITWRAITVVFSILLSFVSFAPRIASAQVLEPNEVYSTTPENSWGVAGLDRGSGNFRYYSPVFAIEQIENTIFAGGKFLQTTNGSQTGFQPYLAAFDRDSGAWKPLFRPDLNWSVFDLASDGERLFAGGEFSVANGQPAAGVVALNATTGATDANFAISISSSNPSLTRIHTLEVDQGWLYLGGWFTSITGPDGTTRNVSHVARIDLASGAVDGAWKPRIGGGAVWEIESDPLRNRVLLGGPFEQVNGIDSLAFAVVDDSQGQLDLGSRTIGQTYFDEPGIQYDFVSTIEAVGDRVLLGGQRHRLLVTDADLNVIQAYTTNRYGSTNGGAGGDFQAIAISEGTAFVACHCWGRVQHQSANLTPIGSPIDVRSAFAIDLESGLIDRSFQPDFSGSSGPWALLVDSQRCLWLGTDAHQVGQRTGRGLVKLCPQVDLAKSPFSSMSLSSTSGAGANFGASYLSDNDRVTNLGAASGSGRTQLESVPHLDIDLGRDASVASVIIWNRTDGGSATRDVRVRAVASNGYSGVWPQGILNPPLHDSLIAGDHSSKRTLSIPINATVRYLRLETDYIASTGRPGFLDLIEVSVIDQSASAGGRIPRIEIRTHRLEPGQKLIGQKAAEWLLTR